MNSKQLVNDISNNPTKYVDFFNLRMGMNLIDCTKLFKNVFETNPKNMYKRLLYQNYEVNKDYYISNGHVFLNEKFFPLVCSDIYREYPYVFYNMWTKV